MNRDSDPLVLDDDARMPAKPGAQPFDRRRDVGSSVGKGHPAADPALEPVHSACVEAQPHKESRRYRR
jgi:hypothetical protein